MKPRVTIWEHEREWTFSHIDNDGDQVWVDADGEIMYRNRGQGEPLAVEEDRHMKWRVITDGVYGAVGHTTKTIPPGVYDIQRSQEIGLVWQRITPRDADIIRFPGAPIDEVVSEIEKFWQSRDRYELYGLPYKRGLLLWGPPGSGKSTTLQLVARAMVERGGYVVQFDNVELFIAGYRVLRQIQPEAPIVVLMEDLDEILKGKTSGGESRLLNLLDGIESTDNVIFLATTNFPDTLGERISDRPSRFDRKIYVRHPDETARRIYLESLVHKDDTQSIDVERYVKASDRLSLAHVKELFISTHILGGEFDEVAERLDKMRAKDTTVSAGLSVEDDEVFSRGYS